ncbi:hypothetical protein ACXYTP_21605 [Tsukamurella ocularis]
MSTDYEHKLLVHDMAMHGDGTCSIVVFEDIAAIEYPVRELYDTTVEAMEAVRRARHTEMTVDMGHGLILAGDRRDVNFTLGWLYGRTRADLARRLGDAAGVDYSYIRVGAAAQAPLRAVSTAP